MPIATDGTEATVELPLEGTWSDGKTFSNTWRNLTATVIKKQDGSALTEGGYKPDATAEPLAINGYSYTLTAPAAGEKEFTLTLAKQNLSGAVKPGSILGDAVEYGIVANRYEQSGNTETNFAGGLLIGEQAACEAACRAFADKVCETAETPIHYQS